MKRTTEAPARNAHASAARRVAALFLAAIMLRSGAAHAYVDPNTGGWLFQLLMPAFTAVVGAWLLLRRWVAERWRALWRRLLRKPSE